VWVPVAGSCIEVLVCHRLPVCKGRGEIKEEEQGNVYNYIIVMGGV